LTAIKYTHADYTRIHIYNTYITTLWNFATVCALTVPVSSMGKGGERR